MIRNYFNMSIITKNVEIENNKWQKSKLKETDSKAYPMLNSYWTNVGQNFSKEQMASIKTQSEWPWSSAYISYIISKSGMDAFFKKSTAHRVYTKDAVDRRNSGKGGFKAYSLSREKDAILAQVGDIVTKPRGVGKKDGTDDEKSKYGATHGDIVWKISENKAYVSGGNIGNTNKINSTITLNSDGSYPENPRSSSDSTKYLMVLKRM